MGTYNWSPSEALPGVTHHLLPPWRFWLFHSGDRSPSLDALLCYVTSGKLLNFSEPQEPL